MRLLNAKSLELSSFDDEPTLPNYAILSHTWGDDEVKIKDLMVLSREQLLLKKAYPKVQNCCAKALEWGLEWVWIDTCCIDQQSSAELSEAINSMYQWYQQSAVCFAYLFDVYCIENDFQSRKGVNQEESQSMRSFGQARWFTRGWCLQELLAPRNMQFFNARWERIGSKYSLKTPISRVTGIDEYGMFIPDLSVLSVAHRMTWAARRETTRPEDIAYCLLGIFNINMPLLYGEGQIRAFGRLQEEIMRRTEDHSIFAWSGSAMDFRNDMVGFLAPDPSGFRYGNVNLCDLPVYTAPLSITGRGIRAELPLIGPENHGKDYLAIIGCNGSGKPPGYYAIPITRIKMSSDVYRRGSPDIKRVSVEEAENASLSTIFLLRHSKPTHLEDKDTTQVWLSLLEMRDCFFDIIGTSPSLLWNSGRRVFAFSPFDFEVHPQMAIALANSEGKRFVLIIDLEMTEGISTNLVEFKETGAKEPVYTDVEQELRLIISSSSRLHNARSELVIGQYAIAATVESVIVYEQALYEIRIFIQRLSLL